MYTFLTFLFSLLACAAPNADLSDSGDVLILDTASGYSLGEADPKAWSTVISKTAVSVAKGSYKQYSFYKYSGYCYAITATTSSGDVALYSHYTGYPTTGSYQYRSSSISSGCCSGCDECTEEIDVTVTKNGTYYISVYGKAASTFDLLVLRDTGPC